jgi:quercetin dioxygenase-like cupin family protein
MAEDMAKSWLFGSFFIGGFECSSQLTANGSRLDMIAASQHDTQARTDYALCRQVGIRAVREAARWPLIDQRGTLRLDAVRKLARLGREMGIGQIWDLMHYGYPDDLDPFAADFVPRFAAYAKAVATIIRAETAGPTYYTPINEISYYAFSGGEIGYMAPFLHGRGGDLKRALVRAAIAGINAIWGVDPEATILNVDPLVRQHPPAGRPDLQAEVDFFNQHVVNEGFDMLAGLVAPELGGSRRHLGIAGFNFYATNQWTIPTAKQQQRFLSPADLEWLHLTEMLVELEARYGGPLVIAETGNAADGRADWLRYLTAEAKRALAQGIDLQAVCLYPVITTPDWEDPTAFFDGGIFDVQPQPDGSLRRVLSLPVAVSLHEAQQQLDPANALTLPEADSPLPSGEGRVTASPNDEVALGDLIVTPLDHVRVRTDNFSYQTLLAGEQLTVDLYCLEPGGSLPPHRYATTEQVWMVLAGEAQVYIGNQCAMLRQGETLLIPAGVYRSLSNDSMTQLIIQQITSPKPWDARFTGPYPAPSAKKS